MLGASLPGRPVNVHPGEAAHGVLDLGRPGVLVDRGGLAGPVCGRAGDCPAGDLVLAGELGEVSLLMHPDDDVEVYLNGVLALKITGYTSDYEEFTLPKTALAALKPGKNAIAIHCHQYAGGQYIDAGLIRLVPRGK